GIGQTDALAVRHLAANHDTGDRALRRSILGDQPHLAIIEQARVTRPERGENFWMRTLDVSVVARCFVGIEPKAFAVLELDRAFAKRAQAKFWALQIDQNADRAAITALDVADGLAQLPPL